jgi:hypothetical protein
MSLVRGEFVQADGLTLVLWQTAATIFVKQRSNEVRLGVFSVCCQPEKPSRLAIVFGQTFGDQMAIRLDLRLPHSPAQS